MKSIKKIVAVTLVTALCFIAMCVPASAINVDSDISVSQYFDKYMFVPSPQYPSLESLPYGVDTLIFELPKTIDNGFTYYRVYIRNDLDFGSTYSIANGTTACLTAKSGSVSDFNFQFVSKAPIYFQTWTYKNDNLNSFEFSDITTVTQGSNFGGEDLPTLSLRGTLNANSNTVVGQFYPATRSNSKSLYGGRYLDSVDVSSFPSYERFDYFTDSNGCTVYYAQPLCRYPSTADLLEMRDNALKDSLESGFDSIVNSVTDASEEIKGAINDGVTRIEGAISEGVGEIIDAGSDMPTVDTNNDWMNDSVTKVNEWLSQLEEFEEQMQGNLNANQGNMNNARDFISSFFEAIPTGLVAVLSLGLVMIVVVKIIGR